MKRTLATLASAAALLPVAPAASGTPLPQWPSVGIPREAQTFGIADRITHNAVPMRLQGFVSGVPASTMVELFRRSLGSPVVENRLGTRHVLGRMQGEFYISVQIEAAGSGGRGSRGTVAVAHLKAAQDALAPARRQEHWASHLPAGTRILGDTISQDGTRTSRLFAYSNSQDEAANRERIATLMHGQGLALERGSAPAHTLRFTGAAKEAVATVHASPGGQTVVVLNVVTAAAAQKPR